jgi:hypothetical protein
MYLEVFTKYIFNQIWDPQNVCVRFPFVKSSLLFQAIIECKVKLIGFYLCST